MISLILLLVASMRALLIPSRIVFNICPQKRFDTILLYMEGYPRKQIAEILHIPHRTVNYYIARWYNAAPAVQKDPASPCG